MRALIYLCLCVLGLQASACQIYENCARRYGNTRVMGVYLAEACSRGAQFAIEANALVSPEQHCNSNYFQDDAKAACYAGIRMGERGTEGPVIGRGGPAIEGYEPFLD
ncbi:MAG: hypothetical protein IT285_13160 [Bdellovibrionales bacterium]|nr:hypothetical protein [Bdellovibrionales bacterium]